MQATRKKRGGRQAVWKWDKQHGKIVRSGKGGIDWYHYQKFILILKLLLFTQTYMRSRLQIIVVEDGAPSHACKYQESIYMAADILKMLWPGNSPDLNMIEPC